MSIGLSRSGPLNHAQVKSRILNVVLALSLFGLSIGLRLPRLDVFVTADELKWVCRSINFYRGLASGDLDLTRQTGHPGVITMWLGVPAMGIDPRSDAFDPCGEPNYTAMVQASSPEWPRFLRPRLFAARRSVAIMTSACLAAGFLLLVRLLGRRVALAATLLMALDPFYLAHGRLLHLDAITASLLYLAVLALALAVREDRPLQWVAAGVLGALAALNKSPALFIGPFAAGVLLVQTIAARRGLRWMVSRGLLWLGPFLAGYVLLWPAMWVAPVQTFRLVLETAFAYAGNPHTNQNYFLGAPCPDPGPLFYPVALGFRLTPWSLLGGLAALPWLGSKSRGRDVMWTLGAFALGFGVLMTLGQKKFDRYLLPVFPVAQTYAAIGLVALTDLFLVRWRRGPGLWLRWAVPMTLVLGLGVTVVAHAPYYLTYYNPLLGGARAATRTILVGWGEGLDLAARYLNALPGSSSARASVRSQTDFAPFYLGETVDESYYDPATIDYVVIYLNEVQRQLDPELHARYYGVQEPLHVVRLKGIEYAWVYENLTHVPPMAYIAAHADPETDAIVVSRPGRFPRFYEGPLRVYTLDPSWDRERLLAALETAAKGAQRIWYLRYGERNASPLLDWLDYQWQTRAFSLESQQFVDADLFLYRTADGLSFVDTEPIPVDVDLRFGDALVLERYILNGPSAQWRRNLGLTLEWRALRDLDAHYALSIHLVDEAGRRWGQGDAWILDEDLIPTAGWRADEVHRQRVMVSVYAGASPGPYEALLRLKDRVSGETLPAAIPRDGSPEGTASLGSLQIAPSPLAPDPERDLSIQNRTDESLVADLTLLGWNVEALPRFGDRWPVALFWRADGPIDADYAVRLELVDDAGREWAAGFFPVASEAYPTSAWNPGQVLWRFYDLEVAQDALAGEAWLRLSLTDSIGDRVLASLDLARLPLRGHLYERPPIPYEQGAIIGGSGRDGSIRLLGYGLDRTTLKPGESLDIVLYWQAASEVDTSLTVFTHLLDRDGLVRAQLDSVPMEGYHPTSAWQVGEIIEDHYRLPLDADAPPGEYRVEIGMYDPAAGAVRQPLFDAQGLRQKDDRLLLSTSIVVR